MKVKILDSSNTDGLERKINEFLETLDKDGMKKPVVIDIKYSHVFQYVTAQEVGDYFTAMILYN